MSFDISSRFMALNLCSLCFPQTEDNSSNVHPTDRNIRKNKRTTEQGVCPTSDSTQSDSQYKTCQVQRQKTALQAHKTVALMGMYIIYACRDSITLGHTSAECSGS